MGAKKFIPNESFLSCDKGSIVTQIQVTHNGRVSLYDTKWVTEADMLPYENILPFGVCSINNKPCSFDPIYWDKCKENFKVNGYKGVYEDACLLCKNGGKIAVSLDTPMSVLQEMADTLGDYNHWILGLALGTEEGTTLTDKFRDFSKQAAEAKKNLSSTKKGLSQIAKESFGENLSKLDFQAKGYQISGSAHGRSFEPGIDVTAKDPKANIDLLEETKFKSGEGKPYTNAKGTRTGRQGSNEWFEKRLEKRVSGEDAKRIADNLEHNPSKVQKLISKVEPNGRVTRYELRSNGTTGAKINLAPATVVKGSSKAANFINNVGTTIQANKAVNAANQWVTRNAHTLSKVGKVAGRGAIVVGIGIDAINIFSAYQEEGEVGDKTKEAIGSATGGLAGGIAGAKIGAAIGALGGPVGILVGGVVGGVLGAFAGSSAGTSIASWF